MSSVRLDPVPGAAVAGTPLSGECLPILTESRATSQGSHKLSKGPKGREAKGFQSRSNEAMMLKRHLEDFCDKPIARAVFNTNIG